MKINDNVCRICSENIGERSHFFKKHRIKEADYYLKHYGFKDLLTNELILFKSPEQYFNADFTNKNNLKKYLESKSHKESWEYCRNWLIRRKQLKNYIFSPTHFELRTLCFPSVKYFESVFGVDSYNRLCNEIGLINRFNHTQKLEFNDKEPQIIIDTRESKPLSFKNPTIIQKLECGDYSAQENINSIYVERKSLQDAIGSFCGKNYDRFCREMQRAKEQDSYIVILIESKISNLFGFNHLGYLHSEASADFILKRMRDLLLKFDNVQICCVDGRQKASEFIVNLYKMKNNPKTIDFQYYIDCKYL